MRKIKGFLVTFIATAGGAGLSPRAPGTMGTLIGLLFVAFTRSWSPLVFFGFALALFFAGWWATWEWSRNTGLPDSQKIVVDEVLGYIVAMGTLPREASILFVQFILFRMFDILKPPPIRQLDSWGKRFRIGPLQSLGVILDDLLAGAFALLAFEVLSRTTPLSTWLNLELRLWS